jgi:hypothetical protein
MTGLCECGCGGKTNLALCTDPLRGWVKGQPFRFLRGHAARAYSTRPDVNPSGICVCGCGSPVTMHNGLYREYVLGHNRPEGVGRKPGSHIYNWLEPGDRWELEERGYSTACWIWSGNLNGGGYGDYGKIYKMKYGEVPEGLELDHLCRVRSCVNPDHLEPVTRQENSRRGARATITRDVVETVKAATGSQVSVAKQTGVSRKTVSAIRRGKYDWRLAEPAPAVNTPKT